MEPALYNQTKYDLVGQSSNNVHRNNIVLGGYINKCHRLVFFLMTISPSHLDFMPCLLKVKSTICKYISQGLVLVYMTVIMVAVVR